MENRRRRSFARSHCGCRFVVFDLLICQIAEVDRASSVARVAIPIGREPHRFLETQRHAPTEPLAGLRRIEPQQIGLVRAANDRFAAPAPSPQWAMNRSSNSATGTASSSKGPKFQASEYCFGSAKSRSASVKYPPSGSSTCCQGARPPAAGRQTARLAQAPERHRAPCDREPNRRRQSHCRRERLPARRGGPRKNMIADTPPRPVPPALTRAIRIVAPHRLVFAIAPQPFFVQVAFVAGDGDDRPN